MFQIALVVFRECLEISMILGIISAATQIIQNSVLYIIAGTMSGIIAASCLAFVISNFYISLGGFGDEILNVSIIFATVIVVGLTAIWVNNYSHQISGKMKDLTSEIEKGMAPKIMVTFVVGTTIFREVAEIILYVGGIASAMPHLEPLDYLTGFLIGVGGSVLVSVAIYYGLSKVAVKYLFKVSFFMLILIAASLASEAAGILTSIGWWGFYNDPLWDSSWLISDFSFAGKILKTLIGYNSKPNILQVIAYLGTIATILVCSKISFRKVK